MKKIALEEHFLSAGFENYWAPTVGDIDKTVCDRLLGQLEISATSAWTRWIERESSGPC
jgi:hypothetical protein